MNGLVGTDIDKITLDGVHGFLLQDTVIVLFLVDPGGVEGGGGGGGHGSYTHVWVISWLYLGEGFGNHG